MTDTPRIIDTITHKDPTAAPRKSDHPGKLPGDGDTRSMLDKVPEVVTVLPVSTRGGTAPASGGTPSSKGPRSA